MSRCPFHLVPACNDHQVPIYHERDVLPSDSNHIAHLRNPCAYLAIVNIEGTPAICKYKSANDFTIAEEIETYRKLAGSPYILRLTGLLRDDDDEIIGFLLPYLGARSLFWYPGEWTREQKIVLTANLLEAVNDIYCRGIHLTDLKRENILLQDGRVKIIDPDTRSTTGYWSDHTKDLTVRSLGATIVELWWEEHHPSRYDAPPDAPGYISALIKACCGEPVSFSEIYALFSPMFETPPVTFSRSSSCGEAWDGSPLIHYDTAASENEGH
ncbi:hypothetical protein C8R47DRAFT_1214329 [Mycena vitilis]|nr:hypothetical protein C8R47DRAFT_1214324 [Mycena vitilis]KAJ6492519.1 hypothetical protein C8R47DRAFT_1214329 [Mycena vitilis]